MTKIVPILILFFGLASSAIAAVDSSKASQAPTSNEASAGSSRGALEAAEIDILRRNAVDKQARQRVLPRLDMLLILLIALSSIFYFLAFYFPHLRLNRLPRISLAATLILGCISILVSLYFDLKLGVSSSNSTGGVRMVAHARSSPLMFYVIIAGKSLAAIFLLLMAARCFTGASNSNHSTGNGA